jgi:hypothetical protein
MRMRKREKIVRKNERERGGTVRKKKRKERRVRG